MADNRRDGNGYPPPKDPGKPKYPPPEEGEDDERSRPPPPNTMTLPSMQYAPAEHGYPQGQRYADAKYAQYPVDHRHHAEREYPPGPRYSQAQAPRYPQDSERYPQDQQRYPPESHRYASDRRSWSSESPTNPNGYPPPPPDSGRYLPPVQPGGEQPRMDEQRRLYEEEQRRIYEERRRYEDRRTYEDRGQFAEPRPPYDPPGYDQYYSRQPAMPAQQVRGASYPADYYGYRAPPYPYSDYARSAPGGAAPAPPPPQQQAAPRQRTSIACRYCRKRKIRCSGYAHTTNGKCTNCDKLRIECVFQPVSSNSTTAFVPISAVPGGVPPGTPLYGSYGQPLPLEQQQQQLQQQQQSQQHARQQPQVPQPHRAYPPPASEYHSSLHSPTSQQSYDGGETRRRRTRPSDDDDEHAVRLPPPKYPPDDDPRRRSPAERDSNGTSPNGYHHFPQPGFDDRTPTPQRNSPGEQLPTRGPPQSQVLSQTPPTASSSGNPMSLDHLIGPEPRSNGPRPSDIDQNMLGRLNRRNGN